MHYQASEVIFSFWSRLLHTLTGTEISFKALAIRYLFYASEKVIPGLRHPLNSVDSGLNASFALFNWIGGTKPVEDIASILVNSLANMDEKYQWPQKRCDEEVRVTTVSHGLTLKSYMYLCFLKQLECTSIECSARSSTQNNVKS